MKDSLTHGSRWPDRAVKAVVGRMSWCKVNKSSRLEEFEKVAVLSPP